MMKNKSNNSNNRKRVVEETVIGVEGHKDLIRDPHSKAVLSVDKEALMNHRKKKAMMKQVYEDSNRIERVENEVSEIKNMLSQILSVIDQKEKNK